jgi:hypothetical protein
MDIRLQYFDNCPNWRVAEARLAEALARLGDTTVVVRERVDTPEAAQRAGFRGSPTILIDGTDPFADADAPVGLTCRIYRTGTGTEPAPTVEQLTLVLANAG